MAGDPARAGEPAGAAGSARHTLAPLSGAGGGGGVATPLADRAWATPRQLHPAISRLGVCDCATDCRNEQRDPAEPALTPDRAWSDLGRVPCIRTADADAPHCGPTASPTTQRVPRACGSREPSARAPETVTCTSCLRAGLWTGKR